jgi:phytoene dehydrogenase-like protein
MGTRIVIGAGPNGLAAAITLAGSGHEVTLLEARDTVGGRARGLLQDTAQVQPWVVKSLGLDVQWRAPAALVSADENGLHHWDESTPGLTEWRRSLERFGPLVNALSRSAPPDIRSDASLLGLVPSALAALKLGRKQGLELARVGPLCAEDWLDEWGIPRAAQAALTLPALQGTWMGPRSPTSALAVLFHQAHSGQEIAGGAEALVDALLRRAQALGVTVRTDAEVCRIRLTDGHAVGVTVADGTELDAGGVLSTVGPRHTLLKLIDPRFLPLAMEQAVQTVRTRGIVAKVDLTLSAPLFEGHERVIVAADTAAVERAFDDAKHRRLPTRPALDLRQSGGDAPTASILVFGAAHDLDGGWTEAGRTALEEAVLRTLSACTDVGCIESVRTRTPADLEAEYRLEGGHLFHGEFSLDQILSFRPHPSLAGYRTPIAGLVLGGAGCHPAGGFTCAQGVLAGRVS